MGGWKVAPSSMDHEAARIDRQTAALGDSTVTSSIKSISCLILGCRGVGVETAKNLILSNVGRVWLWDPTVATEKHRGTNWCVTTTTDEEHCSTSSTTTTSLAQASVSELQSLNPYCRVSAIMDDDDDDAENAVWSLLEQDAVVVTTVVVTAWDILSPPDLLFRLTSLCHTRNIPIILACTHGVTCSIFCDFGPQHTITDATGEPTRTLAVAHMEVLDYDDAMNTTTTTEQHSIVTITGLQQQQTKKVVLVTVAQADHGLDDGDTVVLDDLRGDLAVWNGTQVEVRRVAIASPVRYVCCV